MSDESSFLNRIAAAPGDDELRRAYADWLIERGDRRGELVHVCQAMRAVPVWSDRYWELKFRRNKLWTQCPLDWLEATGYDGSYYDPVFRDGVPDGWRERWRLVREFTERWHGFAVLDVGGQCEAVRQAEERLGLELPPSLREYVAYAHDLAEHCIPGPEYGSACELFHCAFYHLQRLHHHPAISLIYYTLSDGVLGVKLEDLARPDPPTWFYYDGHDHLGNSITGRTPPEDRPVFSAAPSVSLSAFESLIINLPTAGDMETLRESVDDLLPRLRADFPIHARFDDTDIFEVNEMLVIVGGARRGLLEVPTRRVEAIVRRPIPIESIPSYLIAPRHRNTTTSGLLGPERYRREQEEQQRRPGACPPPRWHSILRRQAGPPPLRLDAGRTDRVPRPPGLDVYPGNDEGLAF